MEIFRERTQSFTPFVVGHLGRVVVYYVLYEALQFAMSVWLYDTGAPGNKELWLFASMMVWEYFSMIYVRSTGSKCHSPSWSDRPPSLLLLCRTAVAIIMVVVAVMIMVIMMIRNALTAAFPSTSTPPPLPSPHLYTYRVCTPVYIYSLNPNPNPNPPFY